MDIHTLHVEHTVLLAVYTLLTIVNSRIHRGVRGIHFFSLYSVLLFTGALLVALRGHIPNLASIVGGNMFVVVGYVALFVSLARFFGARLSQIYLQFAIAGVALAAMLQYGWLHPNTERRLLAYSVVLFSQQIHLAIFTARKERRHTHAAATMAAILAVLATMNVVRIFTILAEGVPQDYLSVRGSLVWMVLINTSMQCGIIVSYVWMTASLLRSTLALQASTDPLTGLLNRRGIDRAAGRVLAAIGPANLPSAILVDLDDFKRINDTYGHGCGDSALAAVARTLSVGLRHSDFIGRIGGDEFVAILPETTLETAHAMAVKLDEAIRAIRVSRGTGDFQGTVTVSASFGCAQAEQNMTWTRLLSRCDKHLYEAKAIRRAEAAKVLSENDRVYTAS
jgi:diguanylate cyclase (GGDEF)-like protein